MHQRYGAIFPEGPLLSFIFIQCLLNSACKISLLHFFVEIYCWLQTKSQKIYAGT